MRKQKNKGHWMVFILCSILVMVSGCSNNAKSASSGEFAGEGDIKLQQETNYKATEAYIADFQIDYDESAKVSSVKEVLRWNDPVDRFGELYVSKGDQVVKGQLLATIQVSGASESEKMAAQYALDEAQRYLATVEKQKAEAVAIKEKAMVGLESYEYEYARIDLAQTISQYNQQIADAERSLKACEDRIEEINEIEKSGHLVAPFDGVISSVSPSFVPDERVDVQRDLIVVEDPNSRIFSFANNSTYGIVPYMSSVKVTADEGLSFDGFVVSNQYVGNSSIIQVKATEPISNEATEKFLKASGFVVEAKDALCLPSEAVFSEGQYYYVYIDQDGAQKKHYIKIGGSYKGVTWVTFGLEEGQTVYIVKK